MYLKNKDGILYIARRDEQNDTKMIKFEHYFGLLKRKFWKNLSIDFLNFHNMNIVAILSKNRTHSFHALNKTTSIPWRKNKRLWLDRKNMLVIFIVEYNLVDKHFHVQDRVFVENFQVS